MKDNEKGNDINKKIFKIVSYIISFIILIALVGGFIIWKKTNDIVAIIGSILCCLGLAFNIFIFYKQIYR